MMKKILLLIFIIFFTTPISYAMDNQGLLAKAWEEYYNGNFKRALVLTNNMVGQVRNNAEVFTLRAQIKTELNDIKGAMTDINRAINMAPTVERYLLRAYLWARTNDVTKVSNILDDVFNKSDENERKRNFQIRYYCVIKILDDPNISVSMKYQTYNVMLKAYEIICKRTKSILFTMCNYYPFLMKYTHFICVADIENIDIPDKEAYNLSKQYTLGKIKAIIKETLETSDYGADAIERQVLEQGLLGLYECAAGNMQKGLDIVNKAKKKAKTVKATHDNRTFSAIFEEMVELALAEITEVNKEEKSN